MPLVRTRRLATLLGTTIALLPLSASAWTTGSSGYSGKEDADETCVECHTTGPMVPTARLLGPASLRPGASAVYQLVVDTDVNSAASAKRWVGFEVAASDGAPLATVVQPNPTRLLDGSISHTAAVPRTKLLGVSFQLTAPPTAGDVTLYAAALSTDWTFTEAADTTVTTTLAIAITPNAPDVVTGATQYPPTPPRVNQNVDEKKWGCAVASAPGDSFALVLMLVGALAIARVRRYRWNLS